MLFHTPEFVVFLFAVVLGLGFIHDNERRKLWLLGASYVFAAWSHPVSVLVLVVATLTTFEAARRLAVESRNAVRKAYVGVVVAVTLGLLATFKYADFALENLRALGADVAATPLGLVLPIGISFYVLQAIGYTVDVYRRPARASTSLTDVALFLAFFPRLNAGPILRSAAFFPQLRDRAVAAFEPQTLFLFAGGLAKKILIADNLQPFVRGIFDGDVSRWPSLIVLLAAVALTVQVYCDFSGYTDMAIAVGRLLGYRLPPNFDWPFLARNPSDFWRRWHISFSSWLRDYLYTALPGSRRSSVMRWANTFFLMVVAGLWHGPQWTFVCWGAAHGLMLVAHDAYGTVRKKLNPGYRPATGLVATTLSIVAMQSALLVTMIFFGSRSVSLAWIAIEKIVCFDGILSFSGMALPEIEGGRAMGLMFVFALLHLVTARFGGADGWLARAPLWVTTLASVILGFATYCLWPLDEAPFIYQQF